MRRGARKNMENNSIKDIIRGTNFRFNKALGQNFITDGNLLDAIVQDSGVTSDDIVVEIGMRRHAHARACKSRKKGLFL